jgi:nucleotide-binding universal stress UspA family protein
MLPEYLKILLPVDGSECSKRAALHAFSIAKAFNAEVTVLHVIDIDEEFLTGTYSEELINKLREKGERILEEISKLGEENGIKVRRRIETGDEAKRILELSQEIGADIIVIGAHGKSPLSEFLVGSVSDKVVRHAKIPVLVVRRV